jgi:subtilisin family serine protease
MNQRAAARRLGEVAPGTIIARNDRYRSFRLSTSREARTAKGRVLTASVSCAAGASIAMIDTDVDLAHPALAGSDIRRLAARAADRQASSSRHGTAVASMLVGRTESIAPGLAPGARLIAIDAFHRDASGQDATDAFDLARALDLLSGEDAQIINLSLTGPENGVIGRIVDVLLGQGRVIVAAAGNDGPRAKPLYPAAYPGVIAVTAVDGEGKPWRRAARGDHIAFAAMGVDLALAGRNGGAEAHTGTSFAAPAVAAMIAGKSTSVIRVAGDKPVETMTGRLAAVARDTGAPGRDPVFGFGILNPADACRTAAKPARE